MSELMSEVRNLRRRVREAEARGQTKSDKDHSVPHNRKTGFDLSPPSLRVMIDFLGLGQEGAPIPGRDKRCRR